MGIALAYCKSHNILNLALYNLEMKKKEKPVVYVMVVAALCCGLSACSSGPSQKDINLYTCALADSCYFSNNYKEAVSKYAQAADNGSAIAMTRLGDCCYRGHGQPKDYGKAVEYYANAAELGNAEAQNK